MIFLVEELQVDSMENDYCRAVTWVPIGYVTENPDNAWTEEIIGTGWPFMKGDRIKKFRLTGLKCLE